MPVQKSSQGARATPPATGLRERNKRDKYRRIRNAAQELFVRQGFDETTIRQIASRAEVGVGTISSYAKNKRDLLFLSANDGLLDVLNIAKRCINPADSVLANLVNFCHPYYTFYSQQPQFSQIILREMTFYVSGIQAARFQKTRAATIGTICKIIEHGMLQGILSSVETPRFVGWVAFCIFQVELRRWIGSENLDMRQGLDQLRRALQLLLVGAGAKPQALALPDDRQPPSAISVPGTLDLEDPAE